MTYQEDTAEEGINVAIRPTAIIQAQSPQPPTIGTTVPPRSDIQHHPLLNGDRRRQAPALHYVAIDSSVAAAAAAAEQEQIIVAVFQIYLCLAWINNVATAAAAPAAATATTASIPPPSTRISSPFPTGLGVAFADTRRQDDDDNVPMIDIDDDHEQPEPPLGRGRKNEDDDDHDMDDEIPPTSANPLGLVVHTIRDRKRHLEPAGAATVNKQQRCASVQSAAVTSPVLVAIETAKAHSYLVGDAVRSSATNPTASAYAKAAAQILDHLLERLCKIIDASTEYHNDEDVLNALSDIDDVKHIAGVQIRALQDRKFAEMVSLLDVNWIAANCHDNVVVWQHLAWHRGVKIDYAPETILLNRVIMKTGCCTNPKWAARLPPSLVQDVELVRYLLMHRPEVACYFPPEVFQPDGALHWTTGNQVVQWAFFHCCSNDPKWAKKWVDCLLECRPAVLCHIPVHWAFANFFHCCSNDPKWAKKWIEKLPQALVENESFIHCLLECGPAVLCHIPAGAFQPGRPLYWTPTEDNKRVQRAFRQYFHSKEASSLRNGKLGAKLPREFWSDRTSLCSWLEWGAGLGGIDLKGGIDVTEYGFLKETNAFQILQDQEREFMESKDEDAMARNCWYLLFQHCAKKTGIFRTFEAFASADLKSDKTKMLEIVKLRPHLLLCADETLQLDVDLLVAAVSVSPNFFADPDMEKLGGQQQDGQDNSRAITVLLEGIQMKSVAVAFADVFIQKRLPPDVWRRYFDCSKQSAYAMAAAHLGNYLQGGDGALLENYRAVLNSFLQDNRHVARSEVRTINEEGDEDQSNKSSETDDDSDSESLWAY